MRVLFVCSNPTWTARLDLGDEMREILSSLKGQDVKFMLLPAAQRLDLKTAIASNDIDILHFSGHATKEEGIILRDEDGMEDPVAGTELKDLLTNVDYPVKLTVLNACNTQETAAKIQGSVGAVISTKKELKDTSAKKMTRVLYSQLCAGKTVEQACETAREFVREDSAEYDVYKLEGARTADALFDKPSDEAAENAEIKIEGKSTYDKYFFISYLDEQIRDIMKRKLFNRRAFLSLLVLGSAFFVMLMFQYELAVELYHFVKVSFLGPENHAALVDQYLKKPYLDSMIAIGAAIPALMAFFQNRLVIHGDRNLKSLQQMKELAKASEELPRELQDRLQTILDQCIRGADQETGTSSWFDFLKVFQNSDSNNSQSAGA